MEDRELLELAAKAAGLTLRGWGEAWADEPGECGFQLDDFSRWNPLTDDGDALRLAVRLGMQIAPLCGLEPHFTSAAGPNGWITESLKDGDPYAATRRCIVRAAAEIAKGGQDER